MHTVTVVFLLLIVATAQIASAQNNQTSVRADSQWKITRDKNGIQVYSMAMQDTAIVKARAVTIINAPLEKVQRLVDNLSQRPQWAPYLEYSKIIEKISATEHIEYSLFAAPWPASKRDFVYRVKQSEQQGSKQFVSYRMHSVEHTAIPIQSGLIRGEIFSSEYRLTAISDQQTQVELSYHADPRGWLPNWIVNIIQRAFPYKMMQNLKQQLEPSADES